MGQPVIDPDVIDPSGELRRYQEAQAREYGLYVAVGTIWGGSVPAYTEGHPVPVSNVVKHHYYRDGLVRLAEGAEHAPEVLAALPESHAEYAAMPEPADEADPSPADTAPAGDGGLGLVDSLIAEADTPPSSTVSTASEGN